MIFYSTWVVYSTCLIHPLTQVLFLHQSTFYLTFSHIYIPMNISKGNLLGYIGMQTGEWSSKESNNLLTYSTPSCDIKSLTFWTCYSHVDNVGSNDKTLVTQAKLLVHDQCGRRGLRCCTDVPARHLQSCLPVKTQELRGWWVIVVLCSCGWQLESCSRV